MLGALPVVDEFTSTTGDKRPSPAPPNDDPPPPSEKNGFKEELLPNTVESPPVIIAEVFSRAVEAATLERGE